MGARAAPNVTVQPAEEHGPAAITAAALASADVPEALQETSFACVGDIIDVSMQDGFLRGHGTQVVDGKLMATLCGVIERVNKLVSVRPLASRYVAELGDVVVGRVTDVAGKRWRVDVSAQQAAILQLSAVNLPGGIQRRRTAEDELNMRQLYQEGDLISAEVQSFYADGAVALHTRSLKYGKLTLVTSGGLQLAGGQLVKVQHNLIKRQKQHFVALEALGVDIIFGVNGAVWIAPWAPKVAAADLPPQAQQQANAAALEARDAAAAQPATLEQRQAVTRAANAVRALAALQLAVHAESVAAVIELAVQEGVALAHMLRPPFLALVAGQEAAQRMQTGP